MKTIGGGTVRYVGITLAAPSRSDALGQNESRGVMEVLWGARVMESFRLYPGEEVCVADGADVAPGTRLFWPGTWRNESASASPSREPINDSCALRALLDGRLPHSATVARTAPCDGTVEAIDGHAITLRRSDGGLARVRVLPRRHLLIQVRVGDAVRAGDPLTEGWRSHHRLLRVWGEERLAEHMLKEFETETLLRSLDVSRVHWAFVVRAMLAWRRVTQPGDTGLRRNAVLARDEFERVQVETLARGGAPATAVTVLRGFRAMARERVGGRLR